MKWKKKIKEKIDKFIVWFLNLSKKKKRIIPKEGKG